MNFMLFVKFKVFTMYYMFTYQHKKLILWRTVEQGQAMSS